MSLDEQPASLDVSMIWEAKQLSSGYSEMEGQIAGIDLRIESGERVALMGHEKSGRALLLRTLAGLRPLRGGELKIFEEETSILPYWSDWDEIIRPEKRRKMGVCLEREGLLSNVTAREGMEMLFRFKYGDHSEKLREGATRVVNQLAVRFGIEAALDMRPYAMTSAQRRLVGLARAFLSKPSVLVLENPSEGIGNLNRKRLLQVFEEICSAPDRTLLVSTDDWMLAATFCPRWVVMDEGRIVFDGTAKDFLKTDNPLAGQINGLMERNEIVERYLGKTA